MVNRSNKGGMSAEEKRWQAESDARTLANYQEIMNDRSRRTAAIAQAKKQAQELQQRAQAMTKAYGGKLK